MSKHIEVGNLAVTLPPDSPIVVRVVAVHGDKCAVVDVENNKMATDYDDDEEEDGL